MAGVPEHDAISGQNTTGHEWDGIRELNTPLPKWWIYVFYVCVIWSVGYVIAYPSIPLGKNFFGGMIGYSARDEVATEIAKAAEAKGENLAQIKAKTVDEIAADDNLRAFAMRGGEVTFKENCVPCHQSGGAGAYGFPTLADDEWIWGGTLDDILTTVQHGIRSPDDEDTRFAEMPVFGDGMLDPEQINTVADYVLALSQGQKPAGAGQDIFVEQCAVCHSSDGASADGDGGQAAGGPALNNQLWLYGGKKEDIVAQITKPKHGVMPAWVGRLDEATIKQVVVYVHSLGGGQ